MVWIQDGVPVVGKENPGGDQKAVYLPARADRLGQAVQFGFREYSPIMKEPTGDEEETIRQYETAQARHDTDYNPTPSTKEPQSLKNPNSALLWCRSWRGFDSGGSIREELNVNGCGFSFR